MNGSDLKPYTGVILSCVFVIAGIAAFASREELMQLSEQLPWAGACDKVRSSCDESDRGILKSLYCNAAVIEISLAKERTGKEPTAVCREALDVLERAESVGWDEVGREQKEARQGKPRPRN